MRTETKEIFDNIVDCITCVDGGIRFTHLKIAIEEFDKRCPHDAAAQEIIGVIRRFSKLIDMVTK